MDVIGLFVEDGVIWVVMFKIGQFGYVLFVEIVEVVFIVGLMLILLVNLGNWSVSRLVQLKLWVGKC